MQDPSATTPRFSPRLANLIAVGWVVGLTLIFLLKYDGWLLPTYIPTLWAAVAPALGFGPYWDEFVRSLATDVALVAGLIGLALGVGSAVAGRWVDRRDWLGALCALATGFWILATVALLLGAISLRLVPIVWVGLLAWLLPASRRLGQSSADPRPAWDAWSWTLLAWLVLFALLSLPGTLLPAVEFDELEYHLGALVEYEAAGRIGFLPHNFYSNLPQLTEMLFLILLRSGGSEVAAKLLHWSCGALAAASVGAVALRWWPRPVALTCAALFFVTPLVMDLGNTARIDLATAFFAALAFGCLLAGLWETDGPRRKRQLLWTGWLAGLAIATKWTAIPVVAWPLLGGVGVALWRGRDAGSRWRAGLALAVLGLLLLGPLPWLVKNTLLTHNPVYPLLSRWMPSPHWDAEQARVFAERHYGSGGLALATDWAGLIWQYSMAERGALPLLLIAAMLIVLLRRADRTAVRAGWLFVTAFVGWYLFTYRPWRFLLPVFTVAALVGGYALDAALTTRVARRIGRVVVVTLLGFSLSYAVVMALLETELIGRQPSELTPLQYCLGQVSRAEFIGRWGGGLFEPIIWMNHELPPTAKVVYVAEARIFHSAHPVVWSSPHDRHPLVELFKEGLSLADVHERLRRQGITHVYLNERELRRDPPLFVYLEQLDRRALRLLLEQHTRLAHESRHGKVYQLRD